MGYNLYITRRRNWHDEGGPSITVDECRKYVEACPELFWNDGNIEAKNPDEALIGKMASIATSLGARVQGEEGETYDQAGAAHPAAPPGFIDRLKGLWSRMTTAPMTPMDASQLPFKVGDRVREILVGRTGTVAAIDLKAEHGMGLITVKYDDGGVGRSAA